MVLLHTMRVYRTLLRGRLDKGATRAAFESAVKATGHAPSLCTITGKPLIPLSSESKCKIYMGLRMTDMFGHINNSRYLEAMEFARWYQMASTDLYDQMNRAELFPIISSVDVQYVREIKPMSTVVIRTQIGSSTEKQMVFHQQIESQKGDVIHANGLIRFMWLNKSSYKEKDGSKAKPGPVRTEEAILRLGFPKGDAETYLSSEVLKDPFATMHFGKDVSGYDKKLSKLVSGKAEDASDRAALTEFQNQLSLNATFPVEKIQAVNNADLEWRNVLRREVRSRKELFGKKR